MAISANRYLTLFLLFVAAAVSYAAGFYIGFWLFIAAGLVFELGFWFELIFGKRRRSPGRQHHDDQPGETELWACSACNERNPKSFQVCWRCGTDNAS